MPRVLRQVLSARTVPALLLALALAVASLAADAAGASSCPSTRYRVQPYCRTAALGANERWPPRLTAYSLFVPDWPLAVNPANGARRWPLRNSLGQPIAWIEQRWDPALAGINKTTDWLVYEADGTTLIDSRSFPTQAVRNDPNTPYLGIQGYGCMLSAPYRADPMVVLERGDFGAAGRYMGVRGFLDAAAIPQQPGALVNRYAPEYSHPPKGQVATRGKSVAQLLAADHARTGCSQSAAGFREPRAGRVPRFPGNLLDPQFAWYWHYNGKYPKHEHAVRYEPAGPGVRRVAVDPAGNRLANYATFPFPSIDESAGPPGDLASRLALGRPGAQARIEADTTGIHGGGVVRAILPLDQAYVVKDWFPYVDPNGYCGRLSDPAFEALQPVAQWVLIAIPGTPIEGWVPRKAAATRYDGSGCGS